MHVMSFPKAGYKQQYPCGSISTSLTASHCGHQPLLVLALPRVAHGTCHAQPLPLQCCHFPVHRLLFPDADHHVGPILGQTLGDGEVDPAGEMEKT